jgi:D-alanyl-lipoteichoic acid acyltransferase DltB (MBOAT superfamily)
VFQKIAYLVDLNRGDAAPGTFVDYLLFVAFFPQLIAGPIVGETPHATAQKAHA